MRAAVKEDNPLDMLVEAERALSEGRFIKARSYTSRARGVMQRTLEMHRSFMSTLRGFLESIEDMEAKGYDVAEARQIVEQARSKAVRSRYEQAIKVVSMIEPALKRATYLPFPLLNKNVDILSIIHFTGGNLNYTVRIENPTTRPLGEIIIKPFLQEGMFQEVLERPFGVIDALSYKESMFVLVPRVKDWNVGVGREVLREEGVVMRTRLSSRDGKASYYITIENNSDQIIRDVIVSPMIPAGLEPDPVQGVIEHVSPYGSETVEFKLTPASMEKWADEKDDNVVAIDGGLDEEALIKDGEENPKKDEDDIIYTDDDEDEFDMDDDEDEFDMDDDEDEFDMDDDEDEVFDMDDEIDIDEGSRTDFTPVEAEYNLITMAPSSFPRRIERMLNKKNRIRER